MNIFDSITLKSKLSILRKIHLKLTKHKTNPNYLKNKLTLSNDALNSTIICLDYHISKYFKITPCYCITKKYYYLNNLNNSYYFLSDLIIFIFKSNSYHFLQNLKKILLNEKGVGILYSLYLYNLNELNESYLINDLFLAIKNSNILSIRIVVHSFLLLLIKNNEIIKNFKIPNCLIVDYLKNGTKKCILNMLTPLE